MSHVSSILNLKKQPKFDYDVTAGQQAQTFTFTTDYENYEIFELADR